MRAAVYLDNSATTKIDARVVEAMVDCLQAGHVNPASQHQPGREARRVLEQAKEEIGAALGICLAAPHQDQVIITSGGTEANNLAIHGLVNRPGEILVSRLEHPSAYAAAEKLTEWDHKLVHLPIQPSGHLDPNEVAKRLGPQTRLVCVMLGNHEIGTLQPIRQIATICRERNIPLHCDAVQAVGKLSINFGQLGVDTLAFSAHKFHGPRGVGGLLVRHGVVLSPLLVGGQQQLGLRPGTEPIASVVGMAVALRLMAEHQGSQLEAMESLRNLLERRLIDGAEAVVVGTAPRLPQTLNVAFPGIDRQALMMALDLAGVACSTGSACTSGSSEPSPVLLALGCPQDVVESSIRLSLSVQTTRDEVESAAVRIVTVVKDLRAAKSH